MKVLITGITGFVGSHFIDYLVKYHPKVNIFGIKRNSSKLENVIGSNYKKINFFECDILNGGNVYDIINKIKPEKIFHLAAQSSVAISWGNPSEIFSTNIIGQCNILEAVKKLINYKYNPVIQIAGSSEEYGLVKSDEIPVKEINPLRPLSPYAVSKITQDYMGFQYYKSYGLKIIRTRAFNHSGPRRGDNYVDSSFAKQIAEIEKKLRKPVIKVGNLDAIRDFTDVRDIVEAYWIATEKCEAGEVYNICSGKGYKIREILDKLISLSLINNIEVVQDSNRMRPSDIPTLIGDCTKFNNIVNWKPKISYLDKTLLDILNFWRKKV